MYTASKQGKRRNTTQRKIINIHQNEFSKGYISAQADSRQPRNALSDLTNMEITQDSVARPRPPLNPYGVQPSLPVIGRGGYRWNGQRVELFMMNDSGTGKVYKRIDGGAFTLIGGTYDSIAWAGFCQSNGRVYVYNGVEKTSWLDLSTNTILTSTAITPPSAPTLTRSTGGSPALNAGGPYSYFVRVSANNATGETQASVEVTVTLPKQRSAWILNTDYIDITWSAVTGATSYTVYISDATNQERELATVTGLAFRDDGSLNPNPFKKYPLGNSTDGQVFTWMYNDRRNSQIFGVTANNYLYYSAPGTGDFSPFNGGGFVPIDENGDTQLNYVDGFRDGKGSPVISVFSRGAAGKGTLSHVTFNTLTIGDQSLVYPEIFEANGQAGTYSARGVIKANDSLNYPTGNAFKSTGTSQNIVNILTTRNFSAVIQPDVDNLNLDALDKCVGVEYQDKLFWAVPVGSDENNEIWYCDTSRKNLWVLRWPVAAKDLWLYEDNSGATHFCALVNNRILEFTRAGGQTTQDDGIAWTSRVAFSSLVWDEDGITLANIYRLYFKLLQPKGTIKANAFGLANKGLSQSVGDDTFSQFVSYTGIGVWDYSGKYKYGDDVGSISSFSQSVGVLTVKPKGRLNQLDWEVVTEGVGADYFLSSVNTRGNYNDNLIYRGGM